MEASIRSILSFDLEQLFDPQRFCGLEQSFSEVVLLNGTFRQLCRCARMGAARAAARQQSEGHSDEPGRSCL